MSSGVDLPDRIAGAAEVSRASTMDGVADEDRDLEFDPLANGKPVELVPANTVQICNCLLDSHLVTVLMVDRTGTQCTTPKG